MIRLGATLLCLSLLVGCGASGLHPVRGKVLLDDRPLANATVQFIAPAGGQGALGTTDERGDFQLSTRDPGDGAFAGEYKVIVQPPAPTVSGSAASSPLEAQSGAAPRTAAPVISLRVEYTDAAQTSLKQTVPAKGEVVFKLKSSK
jgi:hypothetical protein